MLPSHSQHTMTMRSVKPKPNRQCNKALHTANIDGHSSLNKVKLLCIILVPTNHVMRQNTLAGGNATGFVPGVHHQSQCQIPDPTGSPLSQSSDPPGDPPGSPTVCPCHPPGWPDLHSGWDHCYHNPGCLNCDPDCLSLTQSPGCLNPVHGGRGDHVHGGQPCYHIHLAGLQTT